MPRVKTLIVEFMDGTTTSANGTRYRTVEGVLTLFYEGYYGTSTQKNWPLVNIKSFGWEGE